MKTSLPSPSSLSLTLGAQASVAWQGLATWLPSQRPATKPKPGPTMHLLPSQQGSPLPLGLPSALLGMPSAASQEALCPLTAVGLGHRAIPGASRGWAVAVPCGHRHFRLCTWLWGPWALTVPIPPLMAPSGKARPGLLLSSTPLKMSLALVQGSAITMRWLFCGKCSPFSHTQSSLDTDKPSRLGFVKLHSLALLVKRTFLFSFWFCFLFLLINSHVWQQYLFHKG